MAKGFKYFWLGLGCLILLSSCGSSPSDVESINLINLTNEWLESSCQAQCVFLGDRIFSIDGFYTTYDEILAVCNLNNIYAPTSGQDANPQVQFFCRGGALFGPA